MAESNVMILLRYMVVARSEDGLVGYLLELAREAGEQYYTEQAKKWRRLLDEFKTRRIEGVLLGYAYDYENGKAYAIVAVEEPSLDATLIRLIDIEEFLK
jgi:hypothetical protein